MKLGEISAPRGATHRKKRLGFGESSGHGKTSGKGDKEQKARSGPGLRPGFEGGQMPLARRVPKRGFRHLRQTPVLTVSLTSLSRFPSGAVVNPEVLAEVGLAKSKRYHFVKILGDGTLAHPLKISAHRFSKSALKKIQTAGGSAEVLKG